MYPSRKSAAPSDSPPESSRRDTETAAITLQAATQFAVHSTRHQRDQFAFHDLTPIAFDTNVHCYFGVASDDTKPKGETDEEKPRTSEVAGP
jgi:hypothetical protein